MQVQTTSRRRSSRLAAAVAVIVVGVLALAGCGGGTDGTAKRSAPQPPKRCTAVECPELPVYSQKRLDPSGVTAANSNETVPAYMTEVLDDLDATWQQWFAELNIEGISPGRELIAPGSSFTSECAEPGEPALTSDFPNAFFCPVDELPDGVGVKRKGSIILPVETFAGIWQGKLLGSKGVMLGDFTAATIIAHEYGHNVMWRLMDAYKMSESQLPTGNDPELLADCFAGNWAATVFARKDLSLKEIAQAAALVISVGDPAPNQGHGTSFERIRALTRGFMENFSSQGQPLTCLKNYWPGVLGI
ncbi:neutral zinc metallopeptidase [Gordonia malaquae]|uniref:neutral zinc metallopeptidase n=1 Tax=Gordonia malaquae TaxID=410332 RepID=UPI003019FF3F